MDALVFEFMGLVVLALCVVVMVIPSSRREAHNALAGSGSMNLVESS